jgi:hypothetical protein
VAPKIPPSQDVNGNGAKKQKKFNKNFPQKQRESLTEYSLFHFLFSTFWQNVVPKKRLV